MNAKKNSDGAKRCVVAYSGGKDSHLAVQCAIKNGFKVESLIYLDGGGFHPLFFNDFKKASLVKLHARLMGIPLAIIKPPASFDSKREETASRLIAGFCYKKKVKKVYCGATAEDDNTLRFKKAAAGYGLALGTPLIKLDFIGVLRECLKSGVKALITGVEKKKNLKKWLGKLINPELIDYIRYRQEAAGFVDGNDFQTVVLNSPLFDKEIKPVNFSKLESRDQYFLEITKYKLV